MQITSLEQFFDSWKEEYDISVFMKDGIVCSDKYENLLFILKDVNNQKPDETNDMREYVKTSTDGGHTWFNVARWTMALLDGYTYNEMQCYINNKHLNNMHAFQHEQLKRTAIINLKKEAGGSSVDNTTIQKYALQQKEWILSEIQYCIPKCIVVCGLGIFESTKSVLGPVSPLSQDRPKLEMASNWEIGTIQLNNTTVPIIQFRHPSTGCNAEKSYRDMLKIRGYLLNI